MAEDRVRAIVLLNVPPPSDQQRTRDDAVAEVKRSAAAQLSIIDAILRDTGGVRLSDAPDALGSIAIEAPRQSLARLRSSSHVRAVIEDQGLTKLG